jgi:hypothetical protein
MYRGHLEQNYLTDAFKGPLKSSVDYHEMIKKTVRSRFLQQRPRENQPSRQASLPAG